MDGVQAILRGEDVDDGAENHDIWEQAEVTLQGFPTGSVGIKHVPSHLDPGWRSGTTPPTDRPTLRTETGRTASFNCISGLVMNRTPVQGPCRSFVAFIFRLQG